LAALVGLNPQPSLAELALACDTEQPIEGKRDDLRIAA
jgi:hypothetical protein